MAGIPISKTNKIFIGGKFPRTESGRYFKLNSNNGDFIANICLSSRKDLREAVKSARIAFPKWSEKSAYNRCQIGYRIAEILEGRRKQFIDEIILTGISKQNAEMEFDIAINRIIYYAGWSDKFIQIFSSVNPVSSSHYNFSVPEPTGVVNIIASNNHGLLGLVSAILPVIIGGNTCVILPSRVNPISAISLAEVLNTSDVPGGVVNILTGDKNELITHFSSHMDVNAIIYYGDNEKEIKRIQENSANNVKRSIIRNSKDLLQDSQEDPYQIMDTQEIKTTWHPIGI